MDKSSAFITSAGSRMSEISAKVSHAAPCFAATMTGPASSFSWPRTSILVPQMTRISQTVARP
jgi:hypothetical protein